MKNQEFLKLLKKNRSKYNSGFTLTELLVGLIMGTVVVGGLGFGLVNLLRNTQTQTAFSEARNNSSRALDFISDEVKRAVEIQNDETNATGFSLTPTKTVVFALNVPELNTSATLGSDPNPGTPERIVYYLEDATDNDSWQGPQVLYRYGPPLDANGNYTTGDWGEEALIDGIDDTALTANACDTAAITAANPTAGGQVPSPAVQQTGFYVCIQDDDQDGTFGEPEDTDNIGISAQLFLTSGVDIGRTNNDTYTANTQVVARARVAPGGRSEDLNSYSANLLAFPFRYGRNVNNNENQPCWTIRNDFGIGKNPSFDPNASTPHADALQDIFTWVHEKNRQPQPLEIDRTKPFTMVASAFAAVDPNASGASECIARGNKFKQNLVSINQNGSGAVYKNVDDNGNDVTAGNEVKADGSEAIHTYEQKVWHTLEFPESGDNAAEIARKKATYNGNINENANVAGDQSVYVFRGDSVVPEIGGYDVNGDGVYDEANGDQPSLREFLRDPNQDGNQDDAFVNADGTFKEGKLGKDQRLVTFEIGQTVPSTADNPNPGFDLQDNLFIITSDAFVN